MGIMLIDSEPGFCMYVLYTGVPLPALHLYVIVRHNFVLVLSIHSTTIVLYMNSLVLGSTSTIE